MTWSLRVICMLGMVTFAVDVPVEIVGMVGPFFCVGRSTQDRTVARSRTADTQDFESHDCNWRITTARNSSEKQKVVSGHARTRKV